MLIVGCSSAPSADVEHWDLKRKDNGTGYLFTARATLRDGEGGWFAPQLTLVDERGCRRIEFLSAIHPISAPDPSLVDGKYHEEFDYKWKVARATLALVHTRNSDEGFESVNIFNGEKVIDPSLSPPEMPKKPCTTPKAELREKAVTDPAGADDEAISQMSSEEVVATAINTAGFLCAKVTNMQLKGREIDVSCTEYRSGRGKVRYRVNTATMRVEQAD